MECRKCHKPLEPDWSVCPYCATPVTKKPRSQKRGNGLGAVYKRGNTWTVRITSSVSVVDGKVKQVRPSKGGFKTKADAVLYLSELAKGTKPKVPTLQSYYDTYSDGKMSKLSESKQTAYRIAFDRLKPLHHRAIDTITIGELQDILNDTCPTYYPARDLRVLLNHLYKLAAVDGNANPNLPSLLELPPLNEEEREPFTQEEQRLLWAAYDGGLVDAAIPLVMIYTGMMTGEMRRLTKGMIDWEKREIREVGLKTKVRKAQSVLLPEIILPVLADLVDRSDDDLVLPISENDFYERYYAALAAAGITRHLTPYSCRHTAATALAIDEAVAPQTVQRLMRWASTRMMDRYVHPSDEDSRTAINRRSR